MEFHYEIIIKEENIDDSESEDEHVQPDLSFKPRIINFENTPDIKLEPRPRTIKYKHKKPKNRVVTKTVDFKQQKPIRILNAWSQRAIKVESSSSSSDEATKPQKSKLETNSVRTITQPRIINVEYKPEHVKPEPKSRPRVITFQDNFFEAHDLIKSELELVQQLQDVKPELVPQLRDVKPELVPQLTHTFKPRPIEDNFYSFECNFCLQKIRTKTLAAKHMRQEHDIVEHSHGCSYCTKRFKNVGQKNLHEKLRHHGEQPKSIFCSVCGVNGISQAGMDAHMRDDHPTVVKEEVVQKLRKQKSTIVTFYPEQSHDCHFCGRNVELARIVRHMKQHRPDHYPHGCEYCLTRFVSRRGLREHVLKMHRHGQPKSIYFCDLCGVSGNSRDGMEKHMEEDHNGVITTDKTWKCPICSSMFGAGLALHQHLSYNHIQDQDKKFKCDKCPAKFPNSSRLKKHEIVHMTARPYACKICGDKFKLPESLTMHSKIHAANLESQFRCSRCPLKFRTKKELNVHILSCNGMIVANKCGFCQQSFLSRADLLVHVLKNHPDKSI